MRNYIFVWILTLLVTTPLIASSIDVVFCIDTTEGMKGEIKALKKKVKAIAKVAHTRMGVVAYRDKGDEYRTKALPLTADVKSVRSFIKELEAAGGGELEDVRAGLAKAINEMKWNKGPRLIVLIGDAGPNKERKDKLSCSRLANKAKEKGITILALACAEMKLAGVATWKRVAQITEGAYEQLPAAKGRRLLIPEDCGSSCDSCNIPCDAAGGVQGAATAEKKVKESTAKAMERAVTDQIRALIK